MDLVRFREKPLIGILRGIAKDEIQPLIKAIIAAGLETIEITMNTECAPELIRQAKKLSADRLCVGAGTVLSKTDLKSALSSGASFIVTPILLPDIQKECIKKKIPTFTGALTPSEVFNAQKSGATYVKVFPAKVFGPGYFKELRGPFGDLKLLACGGVTPENAKEYMSSGAAALAFGASVFRKDWLKAQDFVKIEEKTREFVKSIF